VKWMKMCGTTWWMRWMIEKRRFLSHVLPSAKGQGRDFEVRIVATQSPVVAYLPDLCACRFASRGSRYLRDCFV
jgi:hypothetical protein